MVDHLFLHCPVAMELGLWFWVIWSKLGYAKVYCGAPSLLARLVWSSSKWTYLANCSPFGVFGGKEIAGVSKIMIDLCQTSSYFSLEPYWIGC